MARDEALNSPSSGCDTPCIPATSSAAYSKDTADGERFDPESIVRHRQVRHVLRDSTTAPQITATEQARSRGDSSGQTSTLRLLSVPYRVRILSMLKRRS